MMALSKKNASVLFALLVAFVAASAIFAASAWAQEKTNKTAKKNERLERRLERLVNSPAVKAAPERASIQQALQAAQNGSSGDLAGLPVQEIGNNGSGKYIYRIRILNAENCVVQDGAAILFEVESAPDDRGVNFALVVDNLNVEISSNQNEDRVRVVSIDGPTQDIEFFTDNPDPGTQQRQLLDAQDELRVVSSVRIECDDNNNNDGSGDNGDFPPFFPGDDFFDDDDFDDDDFDEEIEEDIFDDIEDDFDDDTEEGVSATADDDGASADAGGTSADAGDPDEQDPVSGPRGDVVDEIDTGGTPLPPTGGSPVATLTPLAGIALAPLVWIALLATGLSARWVRRRRQR
jgi:hypothetical protein